MNLTCETITYRLLLYYAKRHPNLLSTLHFQCFFGSSRKTYSRSLQYDESSIYGSSQATFSRSHIIENILFDRHTGAHLKNQILCYYCDWYPINYLSTAIDQYLHGHFKCQARHWLLQLTCICTGPAKFGLTDDLFRPQSFINMYQIFWNRLKERKLRQTVKKSKDLTESDSFPYQLELLCVDLTARMYTNGLLLLNPQTSVHHWTGRARL